MFHRLLLEQVISTVIRKDIILLFTMYFDPRLFCSKLHFNVKVVTCCGYTAQKVDFVCIAEVACCYFVSFYFFEVNYDHVRSSEKVKYAIVTYTFMNCIEILNHALL